MKQTYNRTLTACYTGYVVQAIVNNFIPLLFLTFQSTYHISMRSITLLITVNFLIQLLWTVCPLDSSTGSATARPW